MITGRPQCASDLGTAEMGPVEKHCLAVGASVVVFLGAVFCTGVVGFLLGLELGAWIVGVAVVIQSAYAAWAWRAWRSDGVPRRVGLTLLLAWTVLLSAAGAASLVDDTSTDGRHYQGESVRTLVDGWNPLHDHALPSSREVPRVFTNSYPKAIWVLQATAMRAGLDFEGAKAVGGALLASSALIAFVMAFRLGLGRNWSAVVALTLALSPIATTQIATHMVDGASASLLAVAVSLVVLRTVGGARAATALPLWASIVLLVNAKLTGPVIVLGFVLGSELVIRLARSEGASALRPVAGLGAVVVVAALVLGFNPYVTNAWRNGHPLFPAYGPDAHDLLQPFEIGSYVGKGSVERLFVSVLGRSGRSTVLKPPFTASVGEFRSFSSPGVPVGGLGPLASGAIVIAGIGVVLMSVGVRRRRLVPGRDVGALLGVAACGLAVTIAVPASFVARFAPQLWLVVVFALTASMVGGERGSPARRLGAAGMVVLTVNAVLVAGFAAAGQIEQSRDQSRSMRSLAARGKVYEVELGTWPDAERRRLDDAAVEYEVVSRVECPRPYVLSAAGGLKRRPNGDLRRPSSGVIMCEKVRST